MDEPGFIVRTMQDILDHQAPELVTIQNGIISIVNENYEIELSRIKNKADVLEWTHHLLGKSWMTVEIIEQFIEKVCGHYKLPIYGKYENQLKDIETQPPVVSNSKYVVEIYGKQ